MQNIFKRISIIVAALLPVVVLGWHTLKTDGDGGSENIVAREAQPVAAAVQPSSLSPSASTASTNTAPVAVPDAVPALATTPVVVPLTKYADGTYTVTASYDSPAGMESLGVSVTVSGDIVTAAVVTSMAKDKKSSQFQDAFIAGYKVLAIGKNIADIQLSKVSGASLTTKGFNEALSVIKTQAAV